MKRLVLGLAAGTIALALSSCSAVNPEAVRIAGTSVSQREFDQAIHAISSSAEIRKVLADNAAQRGLAVPIPEEGKGEVTTTQVAAFLLSAEAEAAGVESLATAQGLPEAAADVAAAKAEWFPSVLAPAWDNLPSGTRDRLAKAAARLAPLRVALNGPHPDEAALRSFFEANQDQFGGQTFEQVQSLLAQQLDNAWNQPYTNALTATIRTLGVRLDPKYGTWDPAIGFALPVVPLAGKPAPQPAGS